jgi:hypothetical protein
VASQQFRELRNFPFFRRDMGLPSVKMDKELLKWGIQNSDPEKLKEAASNFDPKQVVCHIL